MTDQYRLFGNPVEHSPSPFVHAEFARLTQQDLHYEKQWVPVDQFETALKQFQRQGGAGANITLPFKQQAFALCDELSDRAKAAKAVNAIKILTNGKIYGDNTDGTGLVTDIKKNLRFSIANKNILLIGAGGAARGAIKPLLDEKPKQLMIANRTEAKAIQLANEFASYGTVEGSSFNDLAGQKFDLIINATSASLSNQCPNLPGDILNPHSCCYDMVYAAKPTPFLHWAKKQGAEIIADGLGMLIEQAAESFHLWRNIYPETITLYQRLRQQLP